MILVTHNLNELSINTDKMRFRNCRFDIKCLLIANACFVLLWCVTNIWLCSENTSANKDAGKRASNKFLDKQLLATSTTIYGITPTYSRLTQKADLTRLSHTLMHVTNMHWIIVEDAEEKTGLVTRFLSNYNFPHTHLNAKTDTSFKLKSNDPNWLLPRGVAQRNAGLAWIRENTSSDDEGVVYFMDDDNTYSLQLFDEIKSIKTAGVWPVGITGGLKFEGPIQCKNGKVHEWHTAWKPDRPFPLDMAGFAVHTNLIFKYSSAVYSNHVPRGYLESDFLTKLDLSKETVEAKANQCKDILVWHTRTEKPNMKQETKLIKAGNPSDPSMEV